MSNKPEPKTCPKCHGTQLVESAAPQGGKVSIKCGSCGTIFEAAESTRRKLMG